MILHALADLQDHHRLRISTDGILQVMSQFRISIWYMFRLVLQVQENFAQSGKTLIYVLSLFDAHTLSVGFVNSFRAS